MKLKGTTTYEVPLRYYLILAPVCIFFKLWLSTLRFRCSEESKAELTQKDSFIALAWHNKILGITALRNYFRKAHPMVGLVSPSKDGAWLAAAFKFFGVKTVRGSSKRRGGIAIKEMLDAVLDGNDVCITPDGPRGPKYSIKKGALKLAELSGANMLLLRLKYTRYFTIPTWDSFMFPLPFSKIVVEHELVANYAQLCERAEAKGVSVEQYVECALGGD